MTNFNATEVDFAEWLHFHLDEAKKQCLIAIEKMKSDWAVKGMLGSGRFPYLQFELAEKAFRQGIDLSLGQCRRAERVTKIDPQALRRIAEERLLVFRNALKASLLPEDGSLSGNHRVAMKKLLPKLDEHLTFALRKFDVGLLEPQEPSVPLAMNNSVTIGVMSGGMLQQGTLHSTQTANFNREEARDALRSFADAIKAISLTHEARSELEADVATLKAQLDKATPSPSILHETGRSLRNLVEGTVAGLLTAPATQAAQSLFRAIGLG
jgi:hypothetical protein